MLWQCKQVAQKRARLIRIGSVASSVFILFLLGRPIAHTWPDAPIVHEISTTYLDEWDGTKKLIRGGSYVVEYFGKKYLVTASHLSQGSEGMTSSLCIEPGLADVESDLEVFPLACDIPAMLNQISKCSRSLAIFPRLPGLARRIERLWPQILSLRNFWDRRPKKM